LPGRKNPVPNVVAESLYHMLSEQGFSAARIAATTGMQIDGTCGRSFTGSSESAALAQSLANRLEDVTGRLGATLYKQRWSLKVTPSGVSLLQHVASVRRTSDNDFIGWPTPATRDFKSETATDEFNVKRWKHTRGKPLSAVSTLTGWTAPAATDAERGGTMTERMSGSSLVQLSPLAGWPTCMANDATGSKYTYSRGNHDTPTLKLPGTVELTGWSTPAASDGNGGKRPHPNTTMTGKHPTGRKVNMGLASQAHLGFLKTTPARLTVFGELLTGSSAGMENGGQLRPEHSRWLLGLPPEWDACAVMAMQSLLRRRKSS
jgi:hypothetical protein